MFCGQACDELALRAHSDLRKASGFAITTEPLGFVLAKQVNDILLRVHAWSKNHQKILVEIGKFLNPPLALK